MKIDTPRLRLAIGLALLSGVSVISNFESASAQSIDRATHGSATTVTLCQSISQLSRLGVQRTVTISRNHFSFSFPDHLTVTNSKSTKAVASAVCALPKMPSGTFNCPADFGIVYQLTFSTSHQHVFPVVSADATGCGSVRGISPIRWTFASAGFWRTLGQAMGLPSPGPSTFRGSAP